MLATPRVVAGSHVTLHYRIAVRLDGNEHEVVSTFEARPATVQVGAGQFSEALEQRLIGLGEGQEASFDLAAGETRTTELVVNAAYLGRFYLPLVAVEAMYDATINARAKGQWVEIVEAGR